MDADDEEILRGVLARFGPHTAGYVECGKGWWPLLAQLDRDIAAIAPRYELLQAKQKFGGLRYYVHMQLDGPVRDQVDQLIAEAEDQSMRICEACGQPGELRGGGWISTLCDQHAKADGTA